MELEQKAASLPAEPGVYLFKDALGTILYVGKSSSLRNRVKSYFLESRWLDAKTGSLVREIAEIDYIVVDNEREALALENSLIKQYKPKFNILLRDDKTYPYIRFTAFEKFPRVYVTRRLLKDGSIYFGPFFPHSLAYRIVHFIHRHFRIRMVKLPVFSDQALRRLTMPVLAILGGKDVLIDSTETKQRLERNVPLAEIRYLPEAGHLIPKQTAPILDFLRCRVPANVAQNHK